MHLLVILVSQANKQTPRFTYEKKSTSKWRLLRNISVMAFGHLFNFCLYNRQNSLFISWLKMSAFSQRKSFAVTSSFSSKNVDSMQLFFQIFCIRLHSKGDALRKTTVAIKKIFIRSFNIFLFEIIFVNSYCVGGCYVICSIQIKTKVYKFNFVCMFPISYQCQFLDC